MKSGMKKITRYIGYKIIGPWLSQRVLENDLKPRVRKYYKIHPEKDSLKSILHINTVANQGGAAKIASSLNLTLYLRGFNSQLLVDQTNGSSDTITLPKSNSVKQKILSSMQDNQGLLDLFHLSTFNIKNMSIFKYSDILHLHNLHGSYFSPFALPELTALKPTIWTLHDMQAITGHCAHSFDCDRWQTGCGNCPDLNIYPAVSKDTTAFLWKIKKDIFECSEITIVCPSKWLKKKVEKSILKDKEIRLIYNGIDQDVFKKTGKKEARKQLGLPAEKKILLFSSHYGAENPWKGGHVFSEVYKFFKGTKDILFLNIGGSQAKFQDNRIDIPYIQDEDTMALYYSAADLFIYPSLADNCPLVVLESLSCGTPIVTFRTGGIPELIEHLETGYLANYKDLKDFVKGIKYFLDNPTVLQYAADKTEEIRDSFSLNKMADEYLKLYHQLLRM